MMQASIEMPQKEGAQQEAAKQDQEKHLPGVFLVSFSLDEIIAFHEMVETHRAMARLFRSSHHTAQRIIHLEHVKQKFTQVLQGQNVHLPDVPSGAAPTKA